MYNADIRLYGTWSSNPRWIEQRRIIHLEVALDDRPFGLAWPVFGTEQILGIDLKLDPLESSNTDNRQKHRHQEKVPRSLGHHVPESVEGFRQPFVDEFYAASHACKNKTIFT